MTTTIQHRSPDYMDQECNIAQYYSLCMCMYYCKVMSRIQNIDVCNVMFTKRLTLSFKRFTKLAIREPLFRTGGNADRHRSTPIFCPEK